MPGPQEFERLAGVNLFFDGRKFNKEEVERLLRSLQLRAERVGAAVPALKRDVIGKFTLPASRLKIDRERTKSLVDAAQPEVQQDDPSRKDGREKPGPKTNGKKERSKRKVSPTYLIGGLFLVAVTLGLVRGFSTLAALFDRPIEPTDRTGINFPPGTSNVPVETLSPLPPAATNDQLIQLPTATTYPPIIQNGVEMVFVPAGEFIMGSDFSYDSYRSGDTKPVHRVYLEAFYIDKYEVTNFLYKQCVDTGICLPPTKTSSSTRDPYYGNPEFDSYPVIYIDWKAAEKYCVWRGARLPSEAEWEKAARGTDGRAYPWGNEIDNTYANYNQDVRDTTVVGAYEKGRSVYGVYDMAGNVWEWTSSLYRPYPYQSTDGREDLEASGDRVSRGGAWNRFESVLHSAYRDRSVPLGVYLNLGFRCALNNPQ